MIHSKTKLLAGVFVVLLGLNFVETEPMISDALPEIVGVSKDAIMRFELTQLGQKIRFEQENGIWNITAPFEAKADQARVKALLMQFRKPISMDVLLERGEEKSYGLDASNSIVVELWTAESAPIISFSLGFDGASGSSYVRLSDDDAVYRARVGGRHRFDFPHAEWKNQLIFDFQESEVTQFDIRSASIQYSLHKEQGLWHMEPNLGWELDQEKTKTTLNRLGSLRIGRVQTEPLVRSDLHINMQFAEKNSVEASIALTEYAQIQIDTQVYQSSISVLGRLAKEREFLQDKHILRFQVRTELDTISFLSSNQEIILQQDLSNGLWRVLRPSGMNIDLKSIFYMVNSLSEAEALSFIEHVEGWTPQTTIVLRMLNGREQRLELGMKTDAGVTGRISSRQFVLDAKLVDKIYRAFGQEPL